jgi:hypothetical protein
MRAIQKWMVLLVALFLVTGAAFYDALADDDHKEKRWYQKLSDWDDDDDHGRGKKKRQRYQKRFQNESKHDRKNLLTPVNNSTYEAECGACHFVYQPQLLPSGSWDKIIAGLEDHFGEIIELDPESKKVVAEYLKTNAAERSSERMAIKIMRTLGSQTPLRITEISYIQREHHKIPQDVFKRESVGSLSNCSACHTTAEDGNYEDDYVVIPP